MEPKVDLTDAAVEKLEKISEAWKADSAKLMPLLDELPTTRKELAELKAERTSLAAKVADLEGRLEKGLTGETSPLVAVQKQVDEIDKKMGRLSNGLGDPGAEKHKSIGSLFTADAALLERLKSQAKGEVKGGMSFEGRALVPSRGKTLITTGITPSLIVPMEAGLVAVEQRRLTLRDMIPVRTTTADAIRYLREFAFYSPAATAAVTSITRSSSTATVTTTAAHGLKSGDRVTISGAVQTEYNGTHVVTVTGASTFTFAVDSGATTPATGTILFAVASGQGAADTVAEGSAKPEAELQLEEILAEVRVIAHWIPATRQVLDDAPQLRAYIDARLLYGLQFVEENQILYGSGVAPDLEGILVNPRRRSHAIGSDTELDAIIKAATIANVAEFSPDTVVINPADWETIILERSSTENLYIHGSPLGRGGAPMMIDGMSVVKTNAIAVGDVAVGSFGMALTLWDRERGNIRVSDSHANFFTENKVAILAEERVALANYRPDSIVHLTL